MSLKKVCCICILFSLLVGCASESPIDEEKGKAQTTQISINKNVPQQLTDRDLCGSETTLAVSEEDIQAALEGDEFRVPLNSPVMLVQSGSHAPEAIMQEEMREYYTVVTFSGIPNRKRTVTYNEDKNKDESLNIIGAENMNQVQALHFVTVKGHQKVIIVLQDTSQTGKYGSGLKPIVWIDYENQKLTDAMPLHCLVRFTSVDVAIDKQTTWSSVDYESKVILPQVGNKNSDSLDVAEQQISRLKQETYVVVVKDLVNRYQQ